MTIKRDKEVILLNPEIKTSSKITGTSGNQVDVNADGQMHIVAEGHLCTENSTTDLLLASAIWTGTAHEILSYNGLAVFVTSDVAGTLEVQYSRDGVNDWRIAETYTISAGEEKWFTPPTFGIYFRLQYTNGGTNQASFEITTKLSKMPFKWSSHNINEPISEEDDAELVKAVLTGKKPNGTFDNASLTNGGNFKASIEEFETDVSTNNNTQLNVSPYIVDEFGQYGHILGDNLFRGAIVNVPFDHHEIHCGDTYRAVRVVDIPNGGNDYILIIVPNEIGTGQDQKLYHMEIDGSSESEGEWYIYEAPTVTANGTAIPSYNANRNSAFNDTLNIFHTPTITDNGVLIDNMHVGSGKGVGGSGRSDEWILQNNTIYLARFQNFASGANHISWKLRYYVHPGI